MQFDNKNIIIGDSNHMFTNLYIDLLVNKCGIDKSDICFVSLNKVENNSIINNLNIDICRHDVCELKVLKKCKTITLISLSTKNSKFIRKVFEYSNEFIKKTYIHLADDELDRWIKTKNKHGKLIKTKDNYVGDACIYILDRVSNFIAPNAYFRSNLEFVLERKNFALFDARGAYKTMPMELWNRFINLYNYKGQYTKPEHKILIGGKRNVFSAYESICILGHLRKKSSFLNSNVWF